ncbi:MAG TPA: hypothetical protein DCL75_13910 [Ktedonobacter sp.]|nr:hypothetical protein [Ktedonobacter sp.]
MQVELSFASPLEQKSLMLLVNGFQDCLRSFLSMEICRGIEFGFTLAHEIGHIVMHQIPTENMEEEADRFAAEFLMPSRDISPDLDSITFTNLARLKSYWKVSMAALIVRANDMGKITQRQYRTLFEQMNKNGYRMNEPIPIPVEEPALLKEDY